MGGYENGFSRNKMGEDIDRIHLTQEKYMSRDLVNTVMNPGVP
jgi:hypothetical protein